MSLVSFLTSTFQGIGADIKTIWTLTNGKAADNSALTTTDKSTLVAAINEVKAVADAAGGVGGADINDTIESGATAWSSSKIRSELTLTETAAATAAVDQITDGAGAAYDTLLEIQAELEADDTVVSGIIAAQAKRVPVDAPAAFTTAEKLTGCNNLGLGDPETDYLTIYTTARDS